MVKPKRTQKQEAKEEEPKGASKPLTFHPLSFEQALDALLVIPPESKAETKKVTKKRTTKKRVK